MCVKKSFVFVMLFLLPSAYALTVEPDPVLTGCPYNLTEMVWYDFCLTPVEDAVVYYNISFGVVDPLTVDYPSGQTLDNLGGGVYSKTLLCQSPTGNPPDCLWVDGTYTASVKVTREDYENVYDSSIFNVLPDYPYNSTFSYSGDLNYFNIFWNGEYQDESCFPDRGLAIECYLNDIQQCIPFPFVQNPNSGTCAVPNPIYEFGTSPDGNLNNISCKFYDPKNPSIFIWTNETFKPIAFQVSVSPAITTTVGEPFSLPINVKNIGLLTDNYTVEIIPATPNLVSIERNFSTITNVKTNEMGGTYARVNLLATVQTSIRVNVTSATSCRYGSQCISRLITVTIKGGMYSLPEFDFIGVIQIMIIAVLVFAVINLKKKTYL